MEIRTPDQRLRVFVSSTLGELADERAVVAEAVLGLGLSAVRFESGARPHPPREVYRAYLSQSDVFVGVYWERYGWIAPGMAVSGLEDEFDLSAGLPRLLYVKTSATGREPRLAALLARVEERGTESYRTFATADELGRLVRADLALLLIGRQGNLPQAESMLSAVLADRGRVLGEDHPDTLDSHFKLAETAARQNQRQRAIELCEGVLAAQRRTIGDEHPHAVTTKNVLTKLATDGKHEFTWPLWP